VTLEGKNHGTEAFSGSLVEALRHAERADSDGYLFTGAEELTFIDGKSLRAVLAEITRQINGLNGRAGPRWGSNWRRSPQEQEAEQTTGGQVCRLEGLKRSLVAAGRDEYKRN
jgi:hypothetical protein